MMTSLNRSLPDAGGEWRDVTDGLRPHPQLLWRHLRHKSRGRFLQHASSMRDTHRHRMPPSSVARIAQAQASGLLRIVKGHFHKALKTARGTTVTYRPSGGSEPVRLEVSHALNCCGFRRLSLPTQNRLMQSMPDGGFARADELKLGLGFDQHEALIESHGRSAERIFGIGPRIRGASWEITAGPNLREQAARLAELQLGIPGLSISDACRDIR
ncbi:hypothetical protein DC522_13065 [Microvirga sp. KLBC 81]|uniref:hypothetical protein n=1 Tax=Microvirga sp. KLBC 81 TaxID=1862707 RepID=UPI000D524E82|nr:hypothetical protein [Microvirga sp. KLBC 81]PVE24026.1 hypothetical protein DC522_13065 [Microvirga sp. KLBC 81]